MGNGWQRTPERWNIHSGGAELQLSEVRIQLLLGVCGGGGWGHASGLKREGEHQRLQAALRITPSSQEQGCKPPAPLCSDQ